MTESSVVVAGVGMECIWRVDERDRRSGPQREGRTQLRVKDVFTILILVMVSCASTYVQPYQIYFKYM